MKHDEDLEAVARDGSISISKWPDLLERILFKLDHIVHEGFPTPVLPQPTPHPLGLNAESSDVSRVSVKITSLSNTENGGPAASSNDFSVPRRSVHSPGSQAVVPDSQPSSVAAPAAPIPPQLLSLYSSIRGVLENSFNRTPPYTVQRLSELILHPLAHYRTLPSYLRALDRTVSVSSNIDAFPLPSLSTIESDGNGGNLVASSSGRTLPDDFNGAALTRIPWLRDTASMMIGSERSLATDLRTESTAVIDGPNGAGSIETVTVSVNGHARGERGDSHQRQHILSTDQSSKRGASPIDEEPQNLLDHGLEAEEEKVQARGPEEIGVSDMGPQKLEREGHVFDVEAAVGRPGEAEKVLPQPTDNGENDKFTDADESKDVGMTSATNG